MKSGQLVVLRPDAVRYQLVQPRSQTVSVIRACTQSTNLGHNSIVYMLESQIRYIVQAVRRIGAGPTALTVRPEVQRRFVEWVQARITETVWDRGCTSWYRTASGRNTTNWPDFTFAYRARTRRFDEADYELTSLAAAAR